jgi:hypothetical protein
MRVRKTIAALTISAAAITGAGFVGAAPAAAAVDTAPAAVTASVTTAAPQDAAVAAGPAGYTFYKAYFWKVNCHRYGIEGEEKGRWLDYKCVHPHWYSDWQLWVQYPG